MILEIIQFGYLYLFPSRHNDVGRYNITVRRRSGVITWLRLKRQTTLQNRRRYNFSLRRLFMRRCNDVVFATSSNVSIVTMVTSEKRQLAPSQQRCNDAGVSIRISKTLFLKSSFMEIFDNFRYENLSTVHPFHTNVLFLTR